jgi:hypothetical protein
MASTDVQLAVWKEKEFYHVHYTKRADYSAS